RTEQKDGRKTYYLYTLTYPIALDTTQKGFEFQKSVETNGLTDLAYFMFSKVNDDQVLSKLNHQQFEVPKIQGFCGDFTFKKVKEDKKTALPGANFQLSGTASGSEKTVIMNAACGEDGTVSFDKIPAGNYKLSETTAPEG
ncbi:prealbumin-like fold domain-containing protein, partial [Eubacteriales bacterium DFI.9.88]|nr:prealbumin-like fold domain-containing protein [Eubacteriales bacterium DFI.9.88]